MKLIASLDLESAGRYETLQRTDPVATLVLCEVVLVPPKGPECGNGYERPSPGLEHPANLGHSLPVIVDMFDDVGREDEIEALVSLERWCQTLWI